MVAVTSYENALLLSEHQEISGDFLKEAQIIIAFARSFHDTWEELELELQTISILAIISQI